MKKISRIEWEQYKESASGKEAIALFERISSEEYSVDVLIELISKYVPELVNSETDEQRSVLQDLFLYHDPRLIDFLCNSGLSYETMDEVIGVYPSYLMHELASEDEKSLYDVKQSAFQEFLPENIVVSILLYCLFPEFYIPNFFVMQFSYFITIADKYDIEIPKFPDRTDFRSCCLYYLNMCITFKNFRNENGLSNGAEFCAFLFDYEMSQLRAGIQKEKNPGSCGMFADS